MKNILSIILITMAMICACNISYAQDTKNRVKFYDFDEMLIDGEIKKPSGLLTDVRERAKFNHLLQSVKRSFLKELENTAKEKTFK